MNTAPLVECGFQAGSQIAPAEAIHTTPLGYDRAGLPAGTPLPIPASEELRDRLHGCREVEVAFRGKLGDTLLALSTARALIDWLALHAPGVPLAVRATGPYAGLIARTGLVTQVPASAANGKRALVGDPAAILADREEAEVSVVCDPAAPPCWSSDGRAHPDLPARYYLALERRLGIRLPGAGPFAPVLATGPSRFVDHLRSAGWLSGLTIAAITATSWPERKDYTAQRFAELAERLANAHQREVHLLLIGGQSDAGVHISTGGPRRHVQVLHLDGLSADQLTDLFPLCDLVIGNDTGLTHLAALSRTPESSGPPVVGLYARHSHSKWRTGWPHHHAVATGLSHRMHQGDLCPVRDAIASDTDAHLDAITPASLANLCAPLLNGGRR
ncbi:glycosyltransferase family 9 protein [Streptomyces sp. NPDC056149]|uniref:glycosyltransferase family 9 protein n=1 Tax=Streptomyces sp. NPDC056149 TaxID=3345728 RepID=UPI0035D52E72